jgi:adenine-specific DNA-methyltransferase
MQNLYNDLAKLLEKDERLFSEGKILKNKVSELVFKLDKDLLNLLLKNKQMKEHFFIEPKDGVLIFDQDKFIKFINNKEFLPDSFTTFKNRIGLTENDEYIKDNGKVVLAWGYKDCVLEGGQDKEDTKRDEIFYNEILAPDEIDRLFEPKVLTNFKKFDKSGEHKVEQITEQDNLIIKGNNLLALHSLKKRYAGKIKLIYIDPPYNTENSGFNYNDSFNHSTWLTFMRNRLMIAKDLLSDDGMIFVQIDDIEYAYLKVLMDEIFDRKNLISTITVKSKTPSGVGQESVIFDITERIIAYAKDIQFLDVNNVKIFDEIVDDKSKTVENYNLILEEIGKEVEYKQLKTGKGKPIDVYKLDNFKYKRTPKKDCSKQWAFNNFDKIFRLSPANGGLMKKITPLLPDGSCCISYVPEKGKYANKKIKIYFVDRNMVVMLNESAIKNLKTKEVEKMVNIHNNWTDESLWQGIANEGGVKLKNGKKPEALIKRILDIGTKEGDLILDYHLGSGTTCAVAQKMGRKYMGVEQLDYKDNDSVVRLKNVIKGDQTGVSKSVNWKGGGSFIYSELKQWNEEYMQKIKEAKTPKELADIYKKIQKEAFFRYDIDLSKFDEKDFVKLELKDQKQVLMECLDKNHLYVNYSEIDDSTYKISVEDKKINKQFYGK